MLFKGTRVHILVKSINCWKYINTTHSLLVHINRMIKSGEINKDNTTLKDFIIIMEKKYDRMEISFWYYP